MADSSKIYKATVDNEAVYGTGDGSPTPIPLTKDCVPEPIFDEEIDDDYSSSLAEPPSDFANTRFRMPVKFYLKGTGAAGGTPEWAKMFKAFGLSSTVVPATSIAFSPVNSAFPSVKTVVNLNGVDWTVTGMRGTSLTIPFIAGKRVLCEGFAEGRYNTPTPVAYAAPTFADAAIRAPRVQSMGVVINGVTHVIPQVNMVLDNESDPLENVNAANNGIESIDIIGRKWRLEIPVIRDSNNDVEWFALWEAKTQFAITSTGFGTVGGQRLQFDCQSVQIKEIKNLDHRGRVAYNIVCKILKSSSLANELTITND